MPRATHQRRSRPKGLPYRMTPDVHRSIEAVWRIESPKVIATLTRKVGDVGLAEDLAQFRERAREFAAAAGDLNSYIVATLRRLASRPRSANVESLVA